MQLPTQLGIDLKKCDMEEQQSVCDSGQHFRIIRIKTINRVTIPVSIKDCRIQPVRQFLKSAVYCKFKERLV